MNLQVQSHGFEMSSEIREEIMRRAEKLNEFYAKISRCRVVVDLPHRHSRDGERYFVKIDMTVPGSEIVIKRQGHEDIYIAIREAFKTAKRKLEDYARLQRGDVKYHEEIPPAKISAIYPEKGYGFITTFDGREIYFHENSVINKDFDDLKVGMSVRYVEEKGEKGPQASTVTVID